MVNFSCYIPKRQDERSQLPMPLGKLTANQIRLVSCLLQGKSSANTFASLRSSWQQRGLGLGGSSDPLLCAAGEIGVPCEVRLGDLLTGAEM